MSVAVDRSPEPEALPGRPFVLVLDDEPAVGGTLEVLLEAHGFRARAVTNCKAALEVAESCPRPSLILSDVNMPCRNGFEFLEELRWRGLAESIPVVFLSGRARREDIHQGLAAGARDYITKPFSPDQLIHVVRTHCPSDTTEE